MYVPGMAMHIVAGADTRVGTRSEFLLGGFFVLLHDGMLGINDAGYVACLVALSKAGWNASYANCIVILVRGQDSAMS